MHEEEEEMHAGWSLMREMGIVQMHGCTEGSSNGCSRCTETLQPLNIEAH